jgi:hypothetical protein
MRGSLKLTTKKRIRVSLFLKDGVTVEDYEDREYDYPDFLEEIESMMSELEENGESEENGKTPGNDN